MQNHIDLIELEAQIKDCRLCPRLVAWREEIAIKRRRAYQEQVYWGKPVPGFGDPQAQILAVGLAPGAHGSNRTGRMFTGDASGNFLYPALYKAGFGNQPDSQHLQDGLTLKNLFITALCRCVPPDNKPNPQEITTCKPFLLSELNVLTEIQVIIALGRIAFTNVIGIYRQLNHSLPSITSFPFFHGATYPLGDKLPVLIASYHPSRQNTQTGRLTPEMFDNIWISAKNNISNARSE